jgi:hypothetical protein
LFADTVIDISKEDATNYGLGSWEGSTADMVILLIVVTDRL